LGKKESGIVDPINQGDVRDKQDKFKGVGMEMHDPFEAFRKNKSYTYSKRDGERAAGGSDSKNCFNCNEPGHIARNCPGKGPR